MIFNMIMWNHVTGEKREQQVDVKAVTHVEGRRLAMAKWLRRKYVQSWFLEAERQHLTIECVYVNE